MTTTATFQGRKVTVLAQTSFNEALGMTYVVAFEDGDTALATADSLDLATNMFSVNPEERGVFLVPVW